MDYRAMSVANTAGEDAAEGPLPQTVAGGIEKLLVRGSERGYVTSDELSATLPLDQLSSEEIEDTMTMLSELGIARRARGEPGQEGDGRSEPAARHCDRQEICKPRPAIPRPDPRRQYRADESGRQIRIPAWLQVLDLRHLVDPPGDRALDRRPGAHDPHPGAHDRGDETAGSNVAADAARDRPRADPRRACREPGDAARKGAQGAGYRQGAA